LLPGKLTGIQRAAGKRFFAKIDRFAAFEAAMNVNVGRDFFDIGRPPLRPCLTRGMYDILPGPSLRRGL
jgi:hypothetical protein